jgi:hypothetical protein
MADIEHLRGDTVRVRGPIPVVVYEAAVQAAGTALHWRKTLFTILRTAGMKQHLVDSYETSGLSKFQIARDALDKFAAAGQNGWKAQRRFVAELANLPRADENAPDPVAGQKALDELRRVASDASLLISPEELDRRRKVAAAEDARAARSRRVAGLADVRSEFAELTKTTEPFRVTGGCRL